MQIPSHIKIEKLSDDLMEVTIFCIRNPRDVKRKFYVQLREDGYYDLENLELVSRSMKESIDMIRRNK